MIKNILNADQDTLKSTATVVDGNLILSLPGAVNPIVWKMELGSVKSSALEVRQASDGNHMLLLKTAKGDVHDIAPFASKEQAVKALMAVSNALKAANGKIAPTANQNMAAAQSSDHSSFLKPDASTLKWVLALAGVLCVIFLFALLSKSSPKFEDGAMMGSATGAGSSDMNNDGGGVPQSADDLLKGF